MAKKNTKSKQSHPIYNAVVIAVISIPFIIALIIGGMYLTNVLKIKSLERTLATETAQSRAAHESASDGTHQEKINVLRSLGVIDVTQKSYSEKTDTCALQGVSKGGWVYSNWQQECHFSYTDLLPVAVSRENATSKISASPTAAQLFGKPDEGRFKAVCGFYEKNDSSTLHYFDYSQPEYASGKGCSVDVFKGRSEERHSVSRVIRTFSNEEIDRSKSYIEVTTRWSEYYVSSKLGCKYMDIMCGSPLESPVPAF